MRQGFSFSRRKIMRLFHVSEESNIKIFEPRTPTRSDLDKSKKLVWAIDEKHLPNYLLPRNCPRVTYRIAKNTTKSDIRKFFPTSETNHAVVIGKEWYDTVKSSVLYLYEFDEYGFTIQDETAGYYVAETAQTPKHKYIISNLPDKLASLSIELRTVDDLQAVANEVESSTLEFSFIKMNFVEQKKK